MRALSTSCELRIAVIGAGPVGLALSLLAARRLPNARLSLFDQRPLDRDVSADARTLALALGSVQMLQGLGAWPEGAAQAIQAVHVSQAPPSLRWPGGEEAAVLIDAASQGQPLLGAVLAYGALVAPLQAAWVHAQEAEPKRLSSRFGQAVKSVRNAGQAVELHVQVDGVQTVERFDLAVVAEGGVYAEQTRAPFSHDYGQTAWVGQATLQADAQSLAAGTAFERFTPEGPLALLPLPPTADTGEGVQRAAIVWCVPSADDPVAPLTDTQRIAVLNSRLPTQAGKIVALSALKAFPLGLNAQRSLVQGRSVCIGNAAQTLHPVAGQGLNLGLRDAYALVQALRFAPDADAALRRVEWQRAPDRWSMIATTDFLARSFTWGWPGVAVARGLGLAAVNALPPLKALLAGQMMFGRR